MISWKLWLALYHPPIGHPVFQRFATPQAAAKPRRVLIFIFAGLLVSCLCYQTTLFQSPVGRLFAFSSEEFLAAAVTLNLAYGVLLAAAVSLAIADAREEGVYEALCLTPSGAPGVNWAMCTGALYRRPGLQWLRLGITFLSVVLLIPLTIFFAIPVIGLGKALLQGGAPPSEIYFYSQLFLDLTYASTFIIAFYVGTIQTVVMGGLVGILTAGMRDKLTVRLWSVGLFLLLQLFSALVALIFSLLMPTVYPFFGFTGFLAELSIPVCRFVFFVAVREIVNAALWQTLLRQLNAERDLSTAWASGQV
jgi:hypothetical protein